MHGEPNDPRTRKAELRTQLLTNRRARPTAELDAARTAIKDLVLARCRTSEWRCVAAYEPLLTEPGSRALLAGLHGAGVSVMVPAMLADADLDWTHWHPDPDWPRSSLGVDAISAADAILVPALAVAADGVRLGRGGGSYDRALARAADVPVIALLFDDEVVAELASEPWDRPVSAIVTPSGWRELSAGNTRIGRDR